MKLLKKIPHLQCLLDLVCSIEVSCHLSGFLKCLNLDWELLRFGRKIKTKIQVSLE